MYSSGRALMGVSELSKRSKRVFLNNISASTEDVLIAKSRLHALRTYILILKNKAVKYLPVSVGALVEIYWKGKHQKRENLSEPKPILKFTKGALSLTVSGKNNHVLFLAILDARPAIIHDRLSKMVVVHCDDGSLKLLSDGVSNCR